MQKALPKAGLHEPRRAPAAKHMVLPRFLPQAQNKASPTWGTPAPGGAPESRNTGVDFYF